MLNPDLIAKVAQKLDPLGLNYALSAALLWSSCSTGRTCRRCARRTISTSSWK
jgi:threonine/homoserine efflux transporter RhtA